MIITFSISHMIYQKIVQNCLQMHNINIKFHCIMKLNDFQKLLDHDYTTFQLATDRPNSDASFSLTWINWKKCIFAIGIFPNPN